MRLSIPVLLALAALSFAGCASDDPGSDDVTVPSPTASGSAAPSPSGTANPTGSATTSPTGTSAPPTNGTGDRSATLAAEPVSGEAPLTVLFTLEATGPAASWSIDFGDGESIEGDALPAEAEHTYGAGAFEAVATVTYADGATVTTQPVAVEADAGAAGPQDLHLPFEGTTPVFVPAGLTGIVGVDGPDSHPAMVRFAQENGLNGTYVVYYDLVVEEGVTGIAFEGGTTELAEGLPDFDIVVLGPAGDLTGGSEGSYEHLVVEEPVAGDYTFAVLYWAGPPEQAFTAVVDITY